MFAWQFTERFYKISSFVTMLLTPRLPVTYSDPNKSKLSHAPTKGLKYAEGKTDTTH